MDIIIIIGVPEGSKVEAEAEVEVGDTVVSSLVHYYCPQYGICVTAIKVQWMFKEKGKWIMITLLDFKRS